jgi:hypothetical protein
LFFPGGKKSDPIRFGGARTFADIVDFIRTHAS